MLLFKIIRWKNFLSTGNNWSEINFTETKNTLIVGHNGSGKSTMVDALSFALFGKPHRNINKPQLVNTINNKNCLVEVEFDIGSSNYKVVRGLKPTVFEIWKNGNIINQSSHSKEYQKILEQNIIKLNHKSFHQIVVLGSSSFIPFMQLSSSHRRDVIEDLLDINVFSKMNSLIKERISLLKESIKSCQQKNELVVEKIKLKKKFINELISLGEDSKNKVMKEIEETQNEINELQKENSEHSTILENQKDNILSEIQSIKRQREALLQYKITFNQQIKEVVKNAKFYEENDNCPTCEQEIEEELKKSQLQESKERAKKLNEGIEKANSEINTIDTNLVELQKIEEELNSRANNINSNNKQIERLQKRITDLNNDMVDGDEQKKITEVKKEYEDLLEEKNQNMEEKLKLSEEYSYSLVISEMLKDTGIKTKIIKQYLPVINKLVNQYLQVLDFFVHFELDESFQETIKSRHRDIFSYDSFSEGEKQRIDLSLLFTWRMIAKMKNSVSTNLLVLDETFDSSLDHDGVENLMKILYTLDDNTNTFIISHKGDILDGKFERKIEFLKEKNFSKIKKK